MNIKVILAFSIGPVGSAALGFVTVPLLAWFFSSEDLGRLNIAQMLYSLVVMIFALGLDQAYVREHHSSQNKSLLFKQCFLPGCALLLLRAIRNP
ncbi:MAG: oligosaccharide flippase family protein, partial [Marinagarivorans sp.]|nr:oligosaccharide flippase family protein [Marinagarivorans sp.]